MNDVIKGRRSVRNFLPRDVPQEAVESLLDAARWAPSAGNLQPWFFYVVRGRAEKEALASFALGQSFIARAPVVFVVCADPHISARVYRGRGSGLYCIQDTAAAVQNILLAAHSMGLGGCWVGAFSEEKVAEYLKMPADRRPVAIIPVGYPESAGGRTKRRDLNEIVKFI